MSLEPRRPVPDLAMKRIGMIMEPQAGNAHEVEGILNPAAMRGPDGQLYLFPRLVARGNYSRIGIARVLFDSAGDPSGVERMGIALQPEADYELSDTGGGCEDPRISYVGPLQQYVMTYTALSRAGPRIALAVSDDLLTWRRMGLATFRPFNGVTFDGVDDKDASLFPAWVQDPFGEPSVALVHRPLFPGTRPEEKVRQSASGAMDLHRESIWISYCRLAPGVGGHRLGQFVAHHALACPVARWERLKIGGGPPPILCRHGWLMIYHGVHGRPRIRPDQAQAVLFGGRDGAFARAAELDPLSFRRADFGSRRPAGMPWNGRRRRLPERHRSSRRSSDPRPNSTFITAWRTIGSASRVWMSRQRCPVTKRTNRKLQPLSSMTAR